MKFGPVPVAEAGGAILAHSLHVGALRLRKGVVLNTSHLAGLRAEGVAEVTVARLGPDDVTEDAAAARLAQALVPDPDATGLRLGGAATGRVNVHATGSGVMQVDAARIDAVNRVHPGITVATVPQWQRMADRQMVATIKIIPYAVPEAALRMACDVGQGALALRPTIRRRAVLIQTIVGDDVAGAKGHRVTEARLTAMGATLAPEQVVPHAVGPLAQALDAAEAGSDLLLILTGSATSDLHDTAPEALRRAGGVVHHFGMPVDPGNLLFYGDLRGTPVLGLPGCARSPALNGADWVLERLLCGVPITPADIMGMGVGGLLKDVPQRGRPRDV